MCKEEKAQVRERLTRVSRAYQVHVHVLIYNYNMHVYTRCKARVVTCLSAGPSITVLPPSHPPLQTANPILPLSVIYSYHHSRTRYREISRAHCRVLLRVQSTSINT